MTYSVYQHWDPLKVCVVGRSYPPEFYSWINKSDVRNLFERIAIETEEDFQAIIKKLQEFGVEVVRPELPDRKLVNVNRYGKTLRRYAPPPMNPRDSMVMIGSNFYEKSSFDFQDFYVKIKDSNWPDCQNLDSFEQLPQHIKDECNKKFGLQEHLTASQYTSYEKIVDQILSQGNVVKRHFKTPIDGGPSGAMLARIGKDLFFGTTTYDQDQPTIQKFIDKEFPETQNHIVNTGGHSDATYCPVCPGLIISLHDVPTYADTFPGWEVVYLPNQSWDKVKPFLDLKNKNGGRWWIPGFENHPDVVDTVEQWLSHWTGYVEETVFDVNMLIIDPKNVIVFNYNKQVFDALDRYGIAPHIVPFRHRYFWDGGIHCVTTDLHRDGTMQNYFPNR